MTFADYFHPENVIKLLCKYRVKHATSRHKLHLLADVSQAEKTIDDFKTKGTIPSDLLKLLPARRQWYKPKIEERRKFSSSQKLQEYAIRKTIRTVHIKSKAESFVKPGWYIELDNFLKRIKLRIANPSEQCIQSPLIVPIRKEKTFLCKECRPISIFTNLEDKIIITLTAKYLTDLFDPYFLDSAYAFRSTRVNKTVRTHHDTIEKINEYRSNHTNEDIFVSECDIQKFFDCLNHEDVINAFEGFQEQNGIVVDPAASQFFKQYLDSYSFSQKVYPWNNNGYFKDKLDGCSFKWVEAELIRDFYPEHRDATLINLKIGVPQGGAISCFISNLFLHSVDNAVSDTNDKDLLYLRFCDDMVILHTSRDKCEAALERYQNAIKKLRILVHPPIEFEKYSKDFWCKKRKSKKPYKWGPRSKDKPVVPWLSFVGYNIKYDGSIRVRRKAFEKEIKKQREQGDLVLKALMQNRKSLNDTSRKARGQQVIALESRLISMSVGRINPFEDRIQTLCWTNGFKALNPSTTAFRQLRMLDANRTRVIRDFEKKLTKLTLPVLNPDLTNKQRLKFFGSPFSYHNFLRKKGA